MMGSMWAALCRAGAKKPGRFDLVGKAKYDAWTKVAGTSADEAKTRYITEVKRLLDGAGPA